MGISWKSLKKDATKTKSFLVKDYMQSKVVTIAQDSTVTDAVKTMIKNKTNGLVVVSKDKKVVGILSGLDVIHYLVPKYLEQDKKLASFEASDTFEVQVQEAANVPISKIMTKNVIKVERDSTLIEVAALLSEYKIRQLPVVDENGCLIGYINRTDVKWAIGDILGISSR